jgi:hypothetical protein
MVYSVALAKDGFWALVGLGLGSYCLIHFVKVSRRIAHAQSTAARRLHATRSE